MVRPYKSSIVKNQSSSHWEELPVPLEIQRFWEHGLGIKPFPAPQLIFENVSVYIMKLYLDAVSLKDTIEFDNARMKYMLNVMDELIALYPITKGQSEPPRRKCEL